MSKTVALTLLFPVFCVIGVVMYFAGFSDGYSRGYSAHEIKSLSGKWAPLPKPRSGQLPRVKT